MGHYRKIDPYIWNDEKFMSMSANGQLACIFLMTHPHMTAVGGLRSTIPGVASEHPKLSDKAFREVFDKGIAKVDPKAPLIWFPNFLKYNPPENPNVVKAWVKSLEFLPECRTKTQIILNVKDFLKDFSEAFQKAWPQALAKQEQEQEQEQEDPPKSPQGDKSGGYTQEFLKFWETYPKKVGKAAALKAWRNKNGTRPPVDQLIEKIEQQKQSTQWNRDGGQYIPNPATWLNQERWEDDLTAHKTKEFEVPL